MTDDELRKLAYALLEADASNPPEILHVKAGTMFACFGEDEIKLQKIAIVNKKGDPVNLVRMGYYKPKSVIVVADVESSEPVKIGEWQRV